jgi:hypothetical protein
MPTFKPFADFKLHKSADSAVIEKYTNVLPHALINIWKEYGFGTFAKGFLKTINPDEYQELLNETYMSDNNPIPIFTTALGDIVIIKDFIGKKEKGYWIRTLRYREGEENTLRVMPSLDDELGFFAKVLTDTNTYKNLFFWGDYIEAVKEYGTIPEYDECYGFVPLLGLGGPREVENMQIVKIKEHIMLIKEKVGVIQSEV